MQPQLNLMRKTWRPTQTYVELYSVMNNIY